MQDTVHHVRTEMRQSLVQRLNCSTAELHDKEYSVCGIRTAELKVTAFYLCGSGTAELQVIEYSVLCAEAELQVT